jgi:predicted nucleic acid-binding protein
MLHLDTSFVIDLLREQRRGRGGPATDFLEGHAEEDLALSIFVACELYTGVERSQRPERERAKIEAVCAAAPVVCPDHLFAPAYGRLLAALQRDGRTIATMDLLIATTAMVDSATLVTRNARHFERIEGLRVLGY